MSEATLHQFLAHQGRRPRLLLAREGGHEGFASQLAQLSVKFADAGFDVDIAPLGDAVGLCRQALENDVDAVVSLAAGAFLTELDEALAAEGADHVLRVQALDEMILPSDCADLILAATDGDPASAVLDFLQ